MAIELIDTLAPKNNGTFPMVNAKDVDVDGTRLPAKLDELAAAAGDIESATDDDINALFTGLAVIEVKAAARSGGQTVTVSAAPGTGLQRRYMVTDADKTPNVSYDTVVDLASGWAALPDTGEIAGAEGQIVTVVDNTTQGAKARALGTAILPAPLA
ncbi:hypothetical protein [Bifidobacterium santillanense]|uniref:hypothetical protein n=1 Tax=Bifidobacterium santillanense TaxID=2809028 RepID=UPI001F0ADCE9|nr:hypothetical protein [Bifidobacterium santillanense]